MPKVTKKIEEAAKLTRKELDFIDNTTLAAIGSNQRPLVYLALCSSILGCVIRASEGVLDEELVTGLVLKGIEND